MKARSTHGRWRAGAATLALVARRFAVLAAPMRLALLQALQEGERSVTALAEELGTSQPNVSKHVRVLVEAGMIGRRQEGTTTWCRIADPLVFELCELVCRNGGAARVMPPRRRGRLTRPARG